MFQQDTPQLLVFLILVRTWVDNCLDRVVAAGTVDECDYFCGNATRGIEFPRGLFEIFETLLCFCLLRLVVIGVINYCPVIPFAFFLVIWMTAEIESATMTNELVLILG